MPTFGSSRGPCGVVFRRPIPPARPQGDALPRAPRLRGFGNMYLLVVANERIIENQRFGFLTMIFYNTLVCHPQKVHIA